MNKKIKPWLLLFFFTLLPLFLFTQEKSQNNNTTEPQMVFVKGGTFMMGNDKANPNEKPAHKVIINDFYIGKFEVTQAQWRTVMHNTPSTFSRCDDGPEENISWDEVQVFIQKLNKLTGKHYRLPTEAEWEYAARGGTKSIGYEYSGSDNISRIAWIKDNSNEMTHPVGQKQANELGIYDMSGNVWEWCSDWYDDQFYRRLYSRKPNPVGPPSGSFKIVRGGSWYSNDYCSRPTYRDGFIPGGKSINIGFRLAQDN